jgi:hypothetical protein
MSRSSGRVLCGILLAGGAFAGVAGAATPGEGTVSKAAPKVTWAGQTTGSYFTRVPTAVTADDSIPCQAPSCDSFALTVGDSANLTVGADIDQPADNAGAVTLRIRKPDGSVVVGSSDADAVSAGKPYKVQIKNAPTGVYTVEYWNNFYDGPIDYAGFAELAVPAAATPAPSTGGTTTTPPPASGPAPTQAIDLTVKGAKASGRKATATVTVSRQVSSLSATLKKGSKTLGSARRGTTSGTVKLAVKTKKKLKRGAYSLTVAASDGSTATTKTVKVRVKK